MQFAVDHIIVHFQEKELFMIKAEVCQEPKPSDYPRLKISKNYSQVVLFTSPGIGTIIDPGRSSNFRGEHSCLWVESAFEDFFGSVTLSETKD